MRKPRLFSYGELLWDVFETEERLGGSAANVAYHAALLGAEATLVSRVGDDPRGRAARRQLAEAGVRTGHIQCDRRYPTGTVNVKIDRGEPSFRIGERAAWDHMTADAQMCSDACTADVFCMSTLAQRTPLARGALRDVLFALEHAPGGRRPMTILDLNLRPPHVFKSVVVEAIRHADVVKLNETELAWLKEAVGTDAPIKYLLASGRVRLVALTKGAQGASLFGHSVRLHQAASPSQTGDAVGAGDSFVASLALSLVRQEPLPVALSRAVKYSGWVASKDGAMPRADSLFSF